MIILRWLRLKNISVGLDVDHDPLATRYVLIGMWRDMVVDSEGVMRPKIRPRIRIFFGKGRFIT
jgi:hypothetical protein